MAFAVRLLEAGSARVLPANEIGREPLAALRSVEDHIHGALSIVVDGEAVPHLGFFGPADVCVGTWVSELVEARRALASERGRHLFDEGEQGQPAFLFERKGDRVLVSVVDSELSGAAGDPAWGVRTCSFDELDLGVSMFLSELESLLERAAPGVGRSWIQWVSTSD
jgi:hypothetical protein